MAVRLHDTVTLQCNYDLEGENLYTVKWYKGSKEFYTFIPKELPNTKVFALPGIDVDLSKSTLNEVVLRNVQPAVTGRYKCEVSSDSPNFYTKVVSGYMYVIETPIEDPVLVLEKELLDSGHNIKGNCTSPPSYPAANISWYLNGKRVFGKILSKIDVNPAEMTPSARKKYSVVSEVNLEINDNTFQDGKATLSCIVTIFNIYRGERKEILEEPKPKPRPSSVLGVPDEVSDCQRIEGSILNVILFLSILRIHR